MTYEIICGLTAAAINVVASVNYVVSVLQHKTKPHAFTWIIWSVITGIIFFAQHNANAGPGAWAAGINAVFCCIVFVLSLFKGEKNITRSDWIALAGAFAIIPIWYITHKALTAVIIATIIDGFAYYPTFRKAWIKPHEENYILYASDNIKWILSIVAMTDYSLTNLTYPVFCLIPNFALVFMIVWRRRLQKTSN